METLRGSWIAKGSLVVFSAPVDRMPELSMLTRAEQSIVEMVLHGSSTSQMARKRGTSQATIRKQIESIYRKLRVHSRVELVSLISAKAQKKR